MLKLTGRCTSCQKAYELTTAQMDEAREMGCAFSPCHGAVATIERADAHYESAITGTNTKRRDQLVRGLRKSQ
jgi:hypothetical protein